MRDGGVSQVVHHQPAVSEDVERVTNVDPADLGQLCTVSLVYKEVAVGVRSEKPEPTKK